jgi:hypothetical protein
MPLPMRWQAKLRHGLNGIARQRSMTILHMTPTGAWAEHVPSLSSGSNASSFRTGAAVEYSGSIPELPI